MFPVDKFQDTRTPFYYYDTQLLLRQQIENTALCHVLSEILLIKM